MVRLGGVEADTIISLRSPHAAPCSSCTAVINSTKILIKSKITDIESSVLATDCTHEHGLDKRWDETQLSAIIFVHSILEIIFES